MKIKLVVLVLLVQMIRTQEQQSIELMKQKIKEQYDQDHQQYQHIMTRIVQNAKPIYYLKYAPHQIYRVRFQGPDEKVVQDVELTSTANNQTQTQFFVLNQLPGYRVGNGIGRKTAVSKQSSNSRVFGEMKAQASSSSSQELLKRQKEIMDQYQVEQQQERLEEYQAYQEFLNRNSRQVVDEEYMEQMSDYDKFLKHGSDRKMKDHEYRRNRVYHHLDQNRRQNQRKVNLEKKEGQKWKVGSQEYPGMMSDEDKDERIREYEQYQQFMQQGNQQYINDFDNQQYVDHLNDREAEKSIVRQILNNKDLMKDVVIGLDKNEQLIYYSRNKVPEIDNVKQKQRDEILRQIEQWGYSYQKIKDSHKKLDIRTYLEKDQKVLEMAVSYGSIYSKQGKQHYRRRMETEVHEYLMKHLGDYSMIGERLKVESEEEDGSVYGLEWVDNQRQMYYGKLEDKFKQSVSEDGISFELESEIKKQHDGGLGEELVIKHQKVYSDGQYELIVQNSYPVADKIDQQDLRQAIDSNMEQDEMQSLIESMLERNTVGMTESIFTQTSYHGENINSLKQKVTHDMNWINQMILKMHIYKSKIKDKE